MAINSVWNLQRCIVRVDEAKTAQMSTHPEQGESALHETRAQKTRWDQKIKAAPHFT
jgi:hypothetical protein